MDFDENYIAQYIKGILPPQEMALADARCEKDLHFKAAVDEVRVLMELASLSHAMHVTERVKAARARHQAANRAPKGLNPYFWAAAATAILLIGFGGYILLQPSTFERYYQAPVAAGNFAGPNSADADAQKLYADGNYGAALLPTPAWQATRRCFMLASARWNWRFLTLPLVVSKESFPGSRHDRIRACSGARIGTWRLRWYIKIGSQMRLRICAW
jgi:hypothetical protein